MSFREVLELFVRADVQGAVGDLNRLGVEAERNLDKASASSDRLANRFLYTGAAMVGTAAVLGYGILQLVDRFSEAEHAGLLMDNTLAKMPELAGANRREFDSLALSIMRKTAVDDEAILTAEALLGTFHLTSQEIKTATPLVVDYARKFGVDLNAAAVQVGKAFEGNIGTLQRNGIIIDANAYATDRFGAVIQALRENAGGFAEAEGATFEGRLARVKNELGNFGEAVGGGAVTVLEKFLGVAEPVVDALGDIDAATGGTLGELATLGTVTIAAVGGIMTLVGGATKAKNAVTEWAQQHERLSAVTRASIPPVLALAGVFGTAAVAGNALHQAIDDTNDATETAVDDLKRYNDMQLATNAGVVLAVKGFDGFVDRIREVARESPVTAQRMVDLGNFGADAKKKLERAIDDERKATQQANAVAERDIELTRTQAEMTDEATAAIERQIDATEESFNTQLRAERATRDVTEAQENYNEKVKRATELGGANTDANVEAEQAYDELRAKILDAAAANQANATKLAEARGATDSAKQGNEAYRQTLIYLAGTLEPGSPLRNYLDQLIWQLGIAGADHHSTITADGSQAIDEANRVASAWENAGSRIVWSMGIAKGAIQAVGDRATYGGP